MGERVLSGEGRRGIGRGGGVSTEWGREEGVWGERVLSGEGRRGIGRGGGVSTEWGREWGREDGIGRGWGSEY